jgi:hypothetical protein
MKKSPKEYLDYDEGLDLLVEAIREKYQKDPFVTVLVAGTFFNDTNVGKTTFSGQLCSRLYELGIPFVKTDSFDYLSHAYFSQKLWAGDIRDGGVIILGAEGSPGQLTGKALEKFRAMQDTRLKTECALLGLPFEKIDFRVVLGRPDRILGKEEAAAVDFPILNQYAKTKGP